MTEHPLTTEARLALVAAALFLVAVLLAFLGERTLSLFWGDRELAARAYKAGYAALGGGIAGLAAPWVVTTFTAKLRMLLAAVGSDSSVASLLLRDGVLQLAEIVGFTLMGVFLLAGTVAATSIWLNAS